MGITHVARTFAMMSKLQFHYIFNVDAAVGDRSPNRRDDVLLIQYMLAVWISIEKDPRLKDLMILINGVPSKTDGIFGKKTATEIKMLEAITNEVNTDGQIDPITSSFGTSTGKTRKMLILNDKLFAAGGLRAGIPQTAVPFPEALKKLLFR